MLESYRFISGQHGPLTALLGRRGTAGGGRSLTPGETQAVLRELLLNAKRGDRKHLAMLAGADGGPQGRARTPNRTLMARLVALVERQRIAFVRGWQSAQDNDADGLGLDTGAAGTDRGPAPEDDLVRRAQPDREETALEGRRYLLIPARRWERYRWSGQFEIVRPAEAKGVCERQSSRVGTDADRKAAWLEAAEWLSDPRRRVTDAEGLMLIRRLQAVGGSVESAAPAVTPSQAKEEAATKELTWIEVVVVDDEDRPFHGRLKLQLPDGRTIETTPDEDGSARFDQIAPGSCTLTFVGLDARDFDPA